MTGTSGAGHGPLVLIIRDGWGVSASPESMAEKEGNATLLADTPVTDGLLATYPWSLIGAAGEAVGLPHGQMGNSEVGHLNLGTGRVVYQDSTRITKAIEDGTFFDVSAFVELMDKLNASGGRLHLVGLCSDGGVHSIMEHLYALLELAHRHGVEVLIHCLMDGRDTSPTSGAGFLQMIEDKAAEIGTGTIVTVIGRYYAMDRDKRWDRVKLGYEAIVERKGERRPAAVAAMRQWYTEEKTDEFIPPTIITDQAEGLDGRELRPGDGAVFFNFRADRAREITRAFTEPDFADFERPTFADPFYVCMTEFDETFDLPIAFPAQTMDNTLAQVLAANAIPQLRIAETEKYAHVTFFFNGGVEEPVAGEERCLIPSPKVATYDLKPEMSAPGIAEEVIKRLRSGQYRVVILNFANADMVGHTGILPAAISAIGTVDQCLGEVIATVQELGGVALVTADHGNAERLLDEDGSTFTAHTTNLVHFIYVGADHEQVAVREGGKLADVAPTMLQLLGLPQPAEMTGESLLTAK